ncbi:hypothetical protein ACU4GG_07920 [Streptomyces nojiriensis]
MVDLPDGEEDRAAGVLGRVEEVPVGEELRLAAGRVGEFQVWAVRPSMSTRWISPALVIGV